MAKGSRTASGSGASPCRTLSVTQRAEVEQRLSAEGRLRAANEAELAKLRNARRLKAKRVSRGAYHDDDTAASRLALRRTARADA
jgi:hypothetical protein